jgi:hypothetical protein
VHLRDVQKVKLVPSSAWAITYHELYSIQPSVADAIQGCSEGITIWSSHFCEDLLQIVNDKAGLLLDVGWYPHANPQGAFVLNLLRREGQRWTWESPVSSSG